MKFSVKDLFSNCDQISRKLRIWSHLMKKSLMENFIFCAVKGFGTNFQATFFVKFFDKKFYLVIVHKPAKFHYQTVFTIQEVTQ